MITAISNFKENDSKVNSIKQIKDNLIYNKQHADNFINSKKLNQISFKGNLSKVGKNLLGDVSSNLGKKITRIVEESSDLIKNIIRKINKENELPFTSKPLIAATENDESIISKALKLLADPQVPESNKSVISEKLSELRVMQKMPQNLTPTSATALDTANMKAGWAKDNVIKLAEESETKITNSGHSVGYDDIDEKTGKLTYSGRQKVSNPKKSLHHHDDFNDNSDNLNQHNGLNHNGQTSFGGDGNNVEHARMDDFAVHGDGTMAFDSLSDTHGLGTDLTSGKPDLKGLGNSFLDHSSNAFEGLSEAASKHEVLAGAIDGISNIADNPALQGVLSEVLPGTKFLEPLKNLKDGKIDKALVGGATRAGEIALTVFVGPVKLVLAGLGGVAGTISRLAGNKGEGTGFFGGASAVSKLWGKGREAIEDGILGTEKADPVAIARKQREAYESGTAQIVNNKKQ